MHKCHGFSLNFSEMNKACTMQGMKNWGRLLKSHRCSLKSHLLLATPRFAHELRFPCGHVGFTWGTPVPTMCTHSPHGSFSPVCQAGCFNFKDTSCPYISMQVLVRAWDKVLRNAGNLSTKRNTSSGSHKAKPWLAHCSSE